MDIDYEALLQLFLTESEEGLVALEEGIITLERRPQDGEILAEIFRLVHTLKGDAGMLGVTPLAEVAHQLEDLLERVRDGHRSVDGGLITLLLHSVDVLRDLLARAEEGSEDVGPDHPALLSLLRAAAQRSDETLATASPTTPRPGTQEAAGLSEQQTKSLRVPIDKLDALLDLASEIVIARGQLTQGFGDLTLGRRQLLEFHRQSDRLYRNLQESVMNLRLVPIGPSFRRHVRTVRDLARGNGKQAQLNIEGADVEVDTAMIEQLRDPLMHMIRNALDHGIETPEVRREKGKNPVGQITLRAAYHDRGILIELTDDGAGLRREKIRSRAQALGLVPSDEPSSGETSSRLDNLIFDPGFTTAHDITRLSGRGVGMDVVRRNVEALRGTVTVRSQKDQGTTFTVQLPLTLAMIDGFRVSLGDETYILPLDSIVESMALPASDSAGVHHRTSGVLDLHGETVPYLRLRRILNIDAAPPVRENVVVVRHKSGPVGLVVDAIHGQSQTIIKPLERILGNIGDIAGSTVLGDGHVALILDVPGLLARHVPPAPREGAEAMTP